MAESLTVQTFLARYPEFATQPPERVAQALEDAHPWVDASRWGAAYAQGIASLAAHFVWSTPGLGADSAAARGAVVSERAGDLQIGYAALPSDSASDAWLATSVYGQRYLTLRRMIGLGALVAP
ncbi:DUF4054 domain-containing protein [Xylella fastidiosa]|uniref:DUF4054 domain-containing protein n=2 Tax=Xylella fastidiosa TaxID=2371 RepID=UPI000165D739|nr:DUF4054 domain-containing protein [Xylella fastidiosa]ACA12235.1 conserved hypothetical protein [Xylella fastidiosa M12]MDC6412912.1 DUF4054 domain-containing protein [Xylella fastidiosa subsp. multiplex]MDC6413471.1 DUF4054 domain-containing protein [Xylella fastidiosa subsp. multiplex]MDD0864319.1 DUF4054 domain-containing protein [Xylella fastidiosa subsp. multiplex]MDD0866474.1 DUF4054 domain-containing protein [Xylella fastidiosa subsp. multiplex]